MGTAETTSITSAAAAGAKVDAAKAEEPKSQETLSERGKVKDNNVVTFPNPSSPSPESYLEDLVREILSCQPESLGAEELEKSGLIDNIIEALSLELIPEELINRMTNGAVKRNFLWNWLPRTNSEKTTDLYKRMTTEVRNKFAARLKTTLCRICKLPKFGYEDTTGTYYCTRCDATKYICRVCGKAVLQLRADMCRSCHKDRPKVSLDTSSFF